MGRGSLEAAAPGEAGGLLEKQSGEHRYTEAGPLGLFNGVAGLPFRALALQKEAGGADRADPTSDPLRYWAMTVTNFRHRAHRRQHEATAALKACLTQQEIDLLEGGGTRTFDGMPLLWRSPDGLVHACEAAEIVPDTILVWTVCGRHDVPPSSFLRPIGEGRETTCPHCLQASEWEPRPAPQWRRAAPRELDRPRDKDMVWWRT